MLLGIGGPGRGRELVGGCLFWYFACAEPLALAIDGGAGPLLMTIEGGAGFDESEPTALW